MLLGKVTSNVSQSSSSKLCIVMALGPAQGPSSTFGKGPKNLSILFSTFEGPFDGPGLSWPIPIFNPTILEPGPLRRYAAILLKISLIRNDWYHYKAWKFFF